ncbi:MAG: AAA family ATPase, partial [Deltaproteobacteria bacterium]|nr:AAA family ATPase [Deltaproteobacteria bacterium]
DLLATRLESIKASMGSAGSAGATQVGRALAFLEGTVAPRPPEPVVRPPLSESQNRAVSFVVGQQAAYLWGPPGTGKTQTVAHLVHELVERGDKVLLTAHTNVATDTALLRVLREKQLPPRHVVRVGYYGEELRPFGVGLDEQVDGLLRERYPIEAEAMQRLCNRVAEQLACPPAVLTSAKAALPRQFRVAFEMLERLPLMEEAEVTAQAAKLEEVLEQVEQEVVDNADVVSATLTRLYTSRLLRPYKADSVIIDEASIASLVLAFNAACCARKRIVAVGDFMQLPAIVLAEQPAARLWLGRHVFASARCDRPDREHPLRAMLHEQWRMHPQISQVVSRVFYASRLEDASEVRRRAHAGPALLILDTSRLRTTSETVTSGSKLNRVHASLVAGLVAKAQGTEIAVIAPYRAQVRQIRDAIRETAHARLKSGEVEVFTVHRFQGRDKDLVIFDLVEAPGTKGRFIHELHNADAPNLINVAMSRAKERLVVVANLKHLVDTLGHKTLINRVFAQMRAAGSIEVVASDEQDEALLAQFLGGSAGDGDPRH